MSTMYSLRFKPNFLGGAAWRDVTAQLDIDKIPSISITAERGDAALTASASDLSLTVDNSEGVRDSIFDASRIVGTLPPIAGESVRVPAAHYGEVMFCRLSTNNALWQVAFVGFVDPGSVRFDRQARTCTFTAYSCAKLLESGNAERVHRFYAFVAARPFVLSVDPATGTGAVQHPLPPNGVLLYADGNPIAGANDWWRIYNGVTERIPLLAGDQFQVARSVSVGSWTEGMQTVALVNATFNVITVAAVGAHLYFQTAEAPTDAALVLPLFTASMEILNPWYRSRDWKALIDGSDGIPNCLEAEVNAALATFDVADTVAFNIAGSLPLLAAGKQLFAQPIYQPDVVPGCMGVSYGLYSGTPTLLHQQQGAAFVTGKADVLTADSVIAPVALAFAYNPASVAGYVHPGPDEAGPQVRLLSSSINDQVDGFGLPDYNTNDVPVGGQDLHQFNASEINTESRYDSTHWTRAPSSYRSGSEPKRYYRIYARGRWVPGPNVFKKGIQITEVTTADMGATWTIVANTQNISGSSFPPPEPGNACPFSSPSSRPSMKVFQLAVGSFLYVWTNPFTGEAFSYQSATDDIAPATLIAASAFIAGGSSSSQKLSSSAVHWPDGTATGVTLFFADREDGTGVDTYYYTAGPTWTLATISDLSGLGIPRNLVGADWINAVADSSRTPVRLYVMLGKTLFAMRVSFAAGTLTIHEAQVVTIDQINYDANIEASTPAGTPVSNPNAVAWLTCPVTQVPLTGEPDYRPGAASDSLIVGTSNAVYVVSNTAANIVDVADFSGLSVAAALSKLIILRAYFMLAAADQELVPDPDLYLPAPTISFYARLQTLLRQGGAIDLVDLTEAIGSGTWLQNFQSVQVQNSKLGVGPASSSTTLTDLDGNEFTTNPPRNSASAALAIDLPFITTLSFAQLLANLYAQEFVIPRPGADITVRDPYAQGSSTILKPGVLVKYLLRPPDSVVAEAEIVGRVLTVDYKLETGLVTLAVA